MPKRRKGTKGKCAKKNHNALSEPEELVKAPHSFVINKGLPGGNVPELTKDFRKVMEPFTASNLKARKKNTIKDFVAIAGPMHVSHLSIISRSEMGVQLKICRLPRGPTLTFKVHNFILSRDVVSSLKKQLVIEEAFKHSPLIVLNSFSGEGMHLKLMANMFQNMFPTLNLTNVDLNTVRRCVLLNYNPASKLIDFRHYTIKVVPVGISKGVKKVVQGKCPNLAKCDDISEFLTKAGLLSESEAEDDPSNHVVLPQKIISRGNMEAGKSSIKLTELGPRLSLQLMKIEDGLLDGEVLYHELIHKTEEEKEVIRKKREVKKKLKEKRRKLQADNARKKEDDKKEHKEKSLKGMQNKDQKGKTETDILMKKALREANLESTTQDDDDVEYFREEVGEEPDKDLFSSQRGTKRPSSAPFENKNKRVRFNDNKESKPFTKFNRNDKKPFNKNNRDNRVDKKERPFNKNKKPFNKNEKPFDRNNKFGNKGKGAKGKVDKVNGKNRDYRPIGGGFKKKK